MTEPEQFDIMKFARILDIRFYPMPEEMKVFFKCGIVLFRRGLYDKGEHTDDIQDCEIEYAERTDKNLLENYNHLYKILILKYGGR